MLENQNRKERKNEMSLERRVFDWVVGAAVGSRYGEDCRVSLE